MLKFVCFALLVAHVSAGAVNYTDCGHGEISKLVANECDGGDICQIHKGQEFKLEAEFVANQNSSKIDFQLTANVNGLVIPMPGVNSDGCTYVKCPLVKGSKYSFTYSMMVPKLVPNIKSANMSVKLSGDAGSLVCLTLKGSLVD